MTPLSKNEVRKLTYGEKKRLYRWKLFSFPPPPVYHHNWSIQDWIKYIDSCGVWFKYDDDLPF